MLDKCLNPTCSAKFRTLRDGRVFVKEIDCVPEGDGNARAHKLAYFWLCNSCCRTLTVIVQKGNGVRTVPLTSSPDPLITGLNQRLVLPKPEDQTEKRR